MGKADSFKKFQATAMLAQELHISLEDAEKELENMVVYNDQVKQAQMEASKLVDEMMD